MRASVEPRLPAWWLEHALAAEGAAEPAPPLAGDTTADVAIVGGGYTGLWTALSVRERDPGRRVVLVEAEICGAGPSGRNGGFIHGYWASLASTLPLLGVDGALALARAGEAIVPAVRAFTESRGEDVWLREGGMLMVATAPSQRDTVEAAITAAASVGRPEEAIRLSDDEIAARCVSPVFMQAVLFRDGATVHPGLLVRALRRAAIAAGVEVHERTPAVRVRDGEVATPAGTIRARDVVLATNAALTGWRPAARSLTNFGSYVVLTEPAPDALERIHWTGGEAIVDARMFLHYFRTTHDGRVLMGSGSGPIGFGGRVDARFSGDAPTAARAEAGLRRLLPGLEGVR
ncbi:MAG: NAD(P)/FAD-dependent oxidoreductase, partial [Gaiellaceae bacterium]